MITRNCECIKNNITKNTNTLVYLRLLQTKLIISNVPNKRKEVKEITHTVKKELAFTILTRSEIFFWHSKALYKQPLGKILGPGKFMWVGSFMQ